jgi:hypothetical protein
MRIARQRIQLGDYPPAGMLSTLDGVEASKFVADQMGPPCPVSGMGQGGLYPAGRGSASMTLRCGRLPPAPRGGARELLDHVADIANILAHRNARRVNDPPTSRRAAGGACSENEVASTPIEVLMVLQSVCALAQHEGDHRREADQADHDHCEHAHHPTAQSIKPRHDTNAQVSRRPAAVDHCPPARRRHHRAPWFGPERVLSPWLTRWRSAAVQSPRAPT